MKKFQQFCRYTACFLLCAGAFAGALKFGTLATLPEITSFYPDSPVQWLLVTFPPHSFGILAGTTLIAVLLSGVKLQCKWEILLLALLPAVGAIAGYCNTPSLFRSGFYFNHFASCGAIILAAGIYFADFPEKSRYLFASAAAGAAVTVIIGVYQYCCGFEVMRNFIAAEIAAGKNISPELLARINDTRVYSTTCSGNIFAGYLLLISPLTAVVFFKAGRHFSPERLSSWCFGIAAALLCAAVFLATKTRGAFLAALATMTAAVLLSGQKKSTKAVFTAIVIITIAGGAWYIQKCGRGFFSFAERADYCRTSLKMAASAPLAGHGWDSFQRQHMQVRKSRAAEAARDPHNVILSFAAQCGIPAALSIAAILLAAVIKLAKARGISPENQAVFWGVAAYLCHSMMELNHLAPGIWTLAGTLTAGALAAEPCTIHKTLPKQCRNILLAALIFAAAAIIIQSSVILKQDYALYDCQERFSTGKLQTLLQKYPRNPVIHEYAATIFMGSADLVNAEKHLLICLDLGASPANIWHKLAIIAGLRGDHSLETEFNQKARFYYPAGYPARP